MPRPETGAMRFPDDWTGVFFRGDCACSISWNLAVIAERLEAGELPPKHFLPYLRKVIRILQSCDEKKSGESRPEAQLARLEMLSDV